MENFIFIIEKCNRRSFYLYDLLTEKGYRTIEFSADIEYDSSEKYVFVFPPSKTITSIELEKMPNDCKIFGGKCIDKYLLSDKNITFYKLVEDAVYVEQNSLITAEGAMQITIARTDKALFDTNVIVLGYGKLAKAVSKLFSLVGCKIAIATYSDREYTTANELYDEVYYERGYIDYLKQYDVVINTIPAIILQGEDLKKCKSNALFIDLASYPGGVDTSCLCGTDITFIPALQLPDKVSPKTAADCLFEAISRRLDTSPPTH